MHRPDPATTYLQEAEELLQQVEETILEVHPGDAPGEAIHKLFRAFHTIKGSGAMFGFEAVAAFTHHVETALDKVRDGSIPVSEELIRLILASKDRIGAILQNSLNGVTTLDAEAEKLVASLNALLPSPHAKAEVSGPPTAATPQPAAPAPSAEPEKQSYQIFFRPSKNLMVSGTNPAMLLNELRSLGNCQLQADTSAIPTLENLQPDQCYLAWKVTLATDRGVNAIKDVFIFVEDGSELSIKPSAAQAGLKSAPPAPAVPAPAAAPASPGSEAHGGAGTTAAAQPAAPAHKHDFKDSSLRVSSERLDRLVRLVGEMVMNQSRLSQVAETVNSAPLTGTVEELERLVGELRDTVLSIRMMPIGTTFSRYKRLVHDLSAELGKEIELVTEGAETELDKTVLDQLGDPLVHLIRNCIDHAIEPAEERLRAGKPRHGTIRLAAAHLGSNVVISIQDDGRGLDSQAIRAKAVEKKLLSAEAVVSEEELFNLVFLPGFSTAKKITSVSGRGVGMDVVKRQMDALRGGIRLSSKTGQGTTVSLTLPLTLAIIDGLLVEVGHDQFIIPMAAVAENVELAGTERSRKNGRNVVAVRGELISYIRLRENFGIGGEEVDPEKIVIVRHGTERVGVVVDRVLGSHQTVIQSLGRFYKNIRVVSGATIMGDGRVALILDLEGVVRLAGRQGQGNTVNN